MKAAAPAAWRLVVTEACLKCGLCRAMCPYGAVKVRDGEYCIGPDCRLCLACLESCPAGAVEAVKDN